MCRVKVFLIAWLVLTLCGSFVMAAVEVEPDARLSQKVTLDCTNVRLHTVVERIAAETGVSIRTGKSGEDWKVRDVPIVVCARDIQIGTLLRGIAGTTHLLLSRAKTDDTWDYRIWRDLKRQSELDAYEQSRRAAALAATTYDWDMLCKVKDMPESEFEDMHSSNGPSSVEFQLMAGVTRAASEIIAELGPEVKDRILAGETMVIGAPSATEAAKTHFRAGSEAFWRNNEQYAIRSGQKAPEPLSDKSISKSFIRLDLGADWGYPGRLNIEWWQGGSGFVRLGEYGSYASFVRKQNPDLPARPEAPSAPLLDSLDARYVKLPLPYEPYMKDLPYHVAPSTDGPAFLDEKVKIDAPKDVKKPTYADLLVGISKAIGYSIIAEGAASRTVSMQPDLVGLFGRETTVREALSLSTGIDHMDWYVDEASKLIIGRDKDWTERLKALVPEKVITELSKKMQSSGIELDDLSPLAWLSSNQVAEYIKCCPEHPEVQLLAPIATYLSKDDLAALYFSLSPHDKALARSGKSVPLSSADPAQVCKVMRSHVATRLFQELQLGYPAAGESALKPQLAKSNAFSNPDSLPELWMRIEKKDLSKAYKVDKHTYTIYVEGKGNGAIRAEQSLFDLFPIQARQPKADAAK